LTKRLHHEYAKSDQTLTQLPTNGLLCPYPVNYSIMMLTQLAGNFRGRLVTCRPVAPQQLRMLAFNQHQRNAKQQPDYSLMYRNAKRRIKSAATALPDRGGSNLAQCLACAEALSLTLPPLQRIIRAVLHDPSVSLCVQQEHLLRLAMRLCSSDCSPPPSMWAYLPPPPAETDGETHCGTGRAAAVPSLVALQRASSAWRQHIANSGKLPLALQACAAACGHIAAGDTSGIPFVAVRGLAALNVAWLLDSALAWGGGGKLPRPPPDAAVASFESAAEAGGGTGHTRPCRVPLHSALLPVLPRHDQDSEVAPPPSPPLDVLQAVHSVPLLWPALYKQLQSTAYGVALNTGHAPSHSTTAERCITPFSPPSSPVEGGAAHIMSALTAPFMYPTATHLVRTGRSTAASHAWEDKLVPVGACGGGDGHTSRGGDNVLAGPIAHHTAARGLVLASAVTASLALRASRQFTRGQMPGERGGRFAARALDSTLHLARQWAHDVRTERPKHGGLRSFLSPPGKLASGPSHWGRAAARSLSDSALLSVLTPSNCRSALPCIQHMCCASLLDIVVWNQRLKGSPTLQFAAATTWFGGDGGAPGNSAGGVRSTLLPLERLAQAAAWELHERTVRELALQIMGARVRIWAPLLASTPNTVSVPAAVQAAAHMHDTATSSDDEMCAFAAHSPGFEASIVLRDLRLLRGCRDSLPESTAARVHEAMSDGIHVHDEQVGTSVCVDSMLALPSCALTALLDSDTAQPSQQSPAAQLAGWLLASRANMLQEAVWAVQQRV